MNPELNQLTFKNKIMAYKQNPQYSYTVQHNTVYVLPINKYGSYISEYVLVFIIFTETMNTIISRIVQKIFY